MNYLLEFYICKLCNKRFPSRNEYAKHYQELHKNIDKKGSFLYFRNSKYTNNNLYR